MVSFLCRSDDLLVPVRRGRRKRKKSEAAGIGDPSLNDEKRATHERMCRQMEVMKEAGNTGGDKKVQVSGFMIKWSSVLTDCLLISTIHIHVLKNFMDS